MTKPTSKNTSSSKITDPELISPKIKSNKIAQQNPQKTNFIELTTADNKKINLSSQHLEQWFVNLERDLLKHQKKNSITPNLSIQEDQNDAYLATQFVGRFGIKSPKDVITFLKSPAGDTVKTMIGEYLAEVAAQQEAQRIEYQNEQMHHRLGIIALLLWLVHRGEANAHHFNEIIESQIQKKLHDSQVQVQKNIQSPSDINDQIRLTANQELAKQNLAEMSRSIEHLESELNTLQTQQLEFASELEALEEQESLSVHDALSDEAHLAQAEDYHLFETDEQHHLNSLKETLNHLNQERTNLASTSEKDSSTEKLQEKINGLQERITFLEQQATLSNPEARQTKVQARIADLHSKLEVQLDEITALIEAGKNDEARVLMRQQRGLHLQLAHLNHLIQVHQGDQQLFNAEGQPVQSFKDAAYSLPHHQKMTSDNKGELYLLSDSLDLQKIKGASDAELQLSLVKKIVKDNDGNIYLLRGNEDLASLKASADGQERLSSAKQDYNHLLPQISLNRHLMQHKHRIEADFHATRKQSVAQRHAQCEQTIQQQQNQLTQLQAARATLTAIVEKPTLAAIPTPNPLNSNNNVSSYKAALSMLPREPAPQPSKNSVTVAEPSLKNSVKKPTPQVDMTPQQKINNGLPVNPNIPPNTTIPSPFSTKLKPLT